MNACFTGLVPISSLGALVGENTPVMNQIIDLASMICNVNFRRAGRTIENLGISGMNVKQLRELVRGKLERQF
jgi:opine dehydrogenase